jgi:phosphoenolpyruvate synthase/pyruvate phosphate dikinase
MCKGLPFDCDRLGVAVVKMVNARAAGIGFTTDPVTGDESKVIIEANWGLGEGVVSGVENVDRWTVDKQTLKTVEACIGKKTKCVVNMEKCADWTEVPSDKQDKPCLSDQEIRAVAEVALLLEQRLGQPQDIEWVVDRPQRVKNLFLPKRVSQSPSLKDTSGIKRPRRQIGQRHKVGRLSKAAEKIKKIAFKSALRIGGRWNQNSGAK